MEGAGLKSRVDKRVPMPRKATIHRKTNETDIRLKLNLDGRGRARIATGIRFFDHMLDLVARHGAFDLRVDVRGDLDVDQHHTVEDVGITLGEAVLKALGSKRGILRAGYFLMPMDETLAAAAVDLGGRPYCVVNAKISAQRVGDFQVEVVEDFFQGFAQAAKAHVHLRALYGRSSHHQGEAMFKAFARALRFAAAHFRRRGPLAPRCWTLRGFGSRSRRTKDARTSHRRHQPRRAFSGHLSGTADPLPIQRRGAATARPQSSAGKSAGPASPGKASPHGLEPGFCKTRVTPPRRHRRRRLLLLCSLLRCARFEWVGGGNLLARNRIRGCRGGTKYLCRSVPSGEERRRRRTPIAEFFEDCGMSLAHRIIPCLDTDGERVVKGVNFVRLRDAGDPVALAARYNAEGADELIVLDIAA